METNYSDYIVYVDESGDHQLEVIDQEYPVFVLAFCIFHKDDYVNHIASSIQKFKFIHFGHDMVVLHEHEIRKAQNDFVMLINKEKRNKFMLGLNKLVEDSPFNIISVVIKKKLLKEHYLEPSNPYHLALGYGLERIFSFLNEHDNQASLRTHVVFEGRGRKEDSDLELEFRRVCSGQNYYQEKLPFEIIFADKRINSCGLQLADLVARPIGRYILRPDQPNRAFELIEKKFYRNSDSQIEGYGLKCFP